ncbi:diacylglycerol lipase-beta-like [Polistes fuscatus]|uniref:diacylglycerol lipase-beta-like n=1 Tax=Polistes fuscatus TaxID=30207 RepID=UPI001CA94091|nr:diacylglycerol lipase-beta-like [Polistes fuscatus]
MFCRKKMPALKLFGRKWLTATDDLVYPELFEILIRLIWLILIGIGCIKYYSSTWKCQQGGDLVRVYLLGEAIILGIVMILTFFIIRYSSRGSITDTHSRRYVEPLLTVKILMILPEINWNILGTLWIFNKNIECEIEQYTISVVKAMVFFNWILIGLTIFGFILVFDPLGSMDKHNNNLDDSIEHGKISRIWRRRFKFLWWMRKDESANETFQHVAGLLTALFRGTNLVPSDVMAGLILLRVRQKRETHKLRTLNLSKPKYTVDARDIFINTPSWMTLENAHHFLKLSIASYGWLFVCYQHVCTGCFRLIPNLTFCGCFRKKRKVILDDNCCFCNLSGVRYMSKLSNDDILFASFKNHLCEIPFCVITDHKTSSIAIVIRGSLSLRDLITDIAAASETFECSGLPPGSMAHKGMLSGAKVILKQLNHYKILEMAFNTYPTYTLTVTGHSLGAGIAVLLSILLRHQYPNLRVYAFSTPAGVLTRAAAKVTEEFVLTIGLGDDLVMKLSVESTEDLRTSLLDTLAACRLPKYRVILNGFGYALHGVPEQDLDNTWENFDIINPLPIQQSPLLKISTNTNDENKVLVRDISQRRFSKMRLYNAGLILHLSRCKHIETDTKSKKNKKEKKYEMRWAQPEEFTKLIVMPRMLLDHLPENLEKALATLIEQQKDLPIYLDP